MNNLYEEKIEFAHRVRPCTCITCARARAPFWPKFKRHRPDFHQNYPKINVTSEKHKKSLTKGVENEIICKKVTPVPHSLFFWLSVYFRANFRGFEVASMRMLMTQRYRYNWPSSESLTYWTSPCSAPSPPSPPTLRHSMGNSRRAAGRASSDATVPSVILVSLLQAGVFKAIFYCIKTDLNNLKVLRNDGDIFFLYFDTKFDVTRDILEVRKQ